MLGYRVPAPNEAMLISGGKQKADGDSTLPFKIVTGHGAWVLPILRKTSFLTLAMREAAVTEECVTQQGIALSVRAVIAFKVGSDPASIAAAAQRFLADQNQMDELTGQIFAGHLRSIVGSMTVEAIIRERQTLAENVLDASKIEMSKIGLTVDSLQIQSIDDKGSGYIKALAAPHQATVNQAAQIAQAAADQAAPRRSRRASATRPSTPGRPRWPGRSTRPRSTAPSRRRRRPARWPQPRHSRRCSPSRRWSRRKNAELREAQLIAEVVGRRRPRPSASVPSPRPRRPLPSCRPTPRRPRVASRWTRRSSPSCPSWSAPQPTASRAPNLTILDGTDGVNSPWRRWPRRAWRSSTR